MADQIVLSFSGQYETENMDISSDTIKKWVSVLNGHSDDVAAEIRQGLGLSPGYLIEVDINFRQGSLLWDGILQISAAAWPVANALAVIGGVAGLIKMVRDVVQRVVVHWLWRIGPFLRNEPTTDQLSTTVFVVQLPITIPNQTLLDTSHRRPIDALFGYAAVVTSMSFLLASIALLISVLK